MAGARKLKPQPSTDDVDDVYTPHACSYCNKPIDDPRLLQLFQGHALHKACFGARRFARERARACGKAAEFDRFEAQHPLEFAAKLTDLYLDMDREDLGQPRRGAKHRSLVDEWVNEIVAFAKVSEKQQILFLGQRAYCMYHVREHGMSAEEAQVMWERDVKDTRKTRSHEGVVKVAVRGHLVIEYEKGRVHQSRAESSNANVSKMDKMVSGGDVLRGTELAHHFSDGAQRDRRRRRSSAASDSRSRRSTSPSRSKPRRRSPSKPRPVRDSRSVRRKQTKRGRSTSRRASRRVSSAARESPASSATTLAGWKPPSEAGKASPRVAVEASSLRAGSPPPSSTTQTPKEKDGHTDDIETMTKADFAKHKEGCHRQLVALAKPLEALLKELAAAKEKCEENEEVKKSAEAFEFGSVIASATETLTQWKSWAGACRAMPKAEYVKLHQSFEDVKQARAATMEELKTLVGMSKTWLTDLKRQDKKSKLSPYTLNKHVKDFRANGCTQMRARLASEAFALLQMAEKGEAEGGGDLPATVITSASPFDYGDWSKLPVWKAGESPLQPLLEIITSRVMAQDAHLTSELSRKESKGNRGFFERVIFEDDDANNIQSTADKLDVMPGALQHFCEHWGPFSIAMRKFTFRVGQTTWPCTGVGSFLWARKQALAICVIDVAQLMANTGMEVFSQLEESLESRKNCVACPWKFVVLQKNEVLWVPYATIPMVCGGDDVNTLLAVPVFDKGLKDAADADAMEILKSALLKQVGKDKEREPYKTLADPLTKLFK